MKTVLLSLGFLMLTCAAYAQTNKVEEPYNYSFSTSTNVYLYNNRQSRSVGLPILAGKGLTFEKIGNLRRDRLLGDIYVISIWPVDPASGDISKFTINSTNTSNDELYCITANDFDNNVRKRYKTWWYNNDASLGALIMPIKLRPRKAGIPLDFAQDISFGPSLGWRFRTSHYKPSYFSIIGTLGYTKVTVDSVSTKGYVNEPTKWDSFTYGGGIMYETGKFQVALVIGWDIVGGLRSQKWIYSNRNWISIGIGVQLWKIE